MLTPEIKNYISQSRASGVSDDQIRQTLAGQGWAQADLDEALKQTKMPSWTKYLIAGLIILLVLPLLVWAGIAGYGFYKLKNLSAPSANNNQSNQPAANNQNEPADSGMNFGSCSDSSAKLSSDFPTNFTTYPNSKLVTSTTVPGNGETTIITLYCTSDTAQTVVDYLISYNPSWNIVDKTVNLTPEQQAIVGNMIGTNKNNFLLGGEQGNYMLIINITRNNDQTQISITFNLKP